jgi:hypothetical protein
MRAAVSAIFIYLFSTLTASASQIRFAAAKTTPTGISHSSRVVVGDFNHDGRPDLAISSTYNQVAIFLGKGNGTFTGPTIYNLTFYVTGSLAAGDFNKDGNLDLAVVGGGTSGNGLAFLSGKGDGSFNLPVYSPTTLAGASLLAVVGDFNRDHNLDLFVGGNGSSEVLLGDGKGNFQDGQWENVYGDGVAIGDFNGDGNLDAATTQSFPSYSSTGLSVLLGNGDGTFQLPQAYSGFEEPYAIAVGDFNRDKKLDLVIGDYVFNTVVTLRGNGDGTFTNIGQRYAGVNPGAIAVSDFNLDGKSDLAVSDYGSNQIAILPGKGDGSFLTSLFFSAGNAPSDVVAVDLNHDGSPDLVAVNNVDNTFSVLLNAAGTYVHLTSSPSPSVLGQSVTFKATVRGSVVTSLVPSGTISFKDGANTLGTASLISGTASFTTSSLSTGTHKISVKYSGNANFNPNLSATLNQKVE